MKIFVNKPLKNSKYLPEIIKSIKKTENNHKNSNFDLGRNPMEIVHGHFFFLKTQPILPIIRIFGKKPNIRII